MASLRFKAEFIPNIPFLSKDLIEVHPRAHLANYTGMFQAEAFNGYAGIGHALSRIDL
jgi:hypothetical protein